MKNMIFGIGDLADVLYYELEEMGISVDAFCVNRDYIKEEKHMGKPLVSFESIGGVMQSGCTCA